MRRHCRVIFCVGAHLTLNIRHLGWGETTGRVNTGIPCPVLIPVVPVSQVFGITWQDTVSGFKASAEIIRVGRKDNMG